MTRPGRSLALPASWVEPILRASRARAAGARAPLPALRHLADLAGVDTTRAVRASLGGVPGLWITPPSTRRGDVLLYLHGGAFVTGSARSHRRLASRIADAAGLRTFVVDYRLAPEHPHPAALEDALTVYRQLLVDGITPARIVVAGDSAGGALALALAQRLRDDGDDLPASIGLICPWLDLEAWPSSSDDPLLSPRLLGRGIAGYLPGRTSQQRREVSPLAADLAGLPPLVVDSTGRDPLHPETLRLVAAATRAGVRVDHQVHDDLWHDVHLLAGVVREADEAVRSFGERLRSAMTPQRDVHVGIVGAGMSGLGMGLALKRAGIDTFTILEKAPQLGGTWRDNTYPGLTCDVPSSYYSYSFALRSDWTHMFAPQAQIRDYLQTVADDHDVTGHVRFGAEVADATWTDGRWHVTTSDGTAYEFDVLVCATGILHHPRMPDIDGLASFGGAAFHSARWDHDTPVDGRRVAVVGTGSTGAQITSALSTRTSRLLVFQRTPQWVLPLRNVPYPAMLRGMLRRTPAGPQLAYRANQTVFEFFAGATTEPGLRRRTVQTLFRAGLRLQVHDPELRRQLTPPDEPLCKRGVISGDFYRAVQRPGVEIVDQPIHRIEPHGIRTEDGTLHEVDVIVFATGFDAHAYMRPMQINGLDRSLEEYWADGPRAYRSVGLPGFPNLFTLLGPHSPVGNYSLIAVAETQIAWVMGWVQRLRRGEVCTTMPTDKATDAYNEQLRSAMGRTVWASGCSSWYIGPDGLPSSFPWTPQRYRQLLDEHVEEDFAIDADAPTPVAG